MAYHKSSYIILVIYFLLNVTCDIPSPAKNYPAYDRDDQYLDSASFIYEYPDKYNTVKCSYSVSNINQYSHNLTGNRKIGYKLGFWNCGRALISNSEHETATFIETKLLIQKHKPHSFGAIESDLHGLDSCIKRSKKYKTEEIKTKLHIDGYTIFLPETWAHHGQARVIVYVSDTLKIKQCKISAQFIDLPMVSLEIGVGRERKTIVNLFYREWTSGVTGDSSQAAT